MLRFLAIDRPKNSPLFRHGFQSHGFPMNILANSPSLLIFNGICEILAIFKASFSRQFTNIMDKIRITITRRLKSAIAEFIEQ